MAPLESPASTAMSSIVAPLYPRAPNTLRAARRIRSRFAERFSARVRGLFVCVLSLTVSSIDLRNNQSRDSNQSVDSDHLGRLSHDGRRLRSSDPRHGGDDGGDD